MDFKQLEAYVQIIELGSFSKAADMVYLSQPSVSTYVNALEKELDAVLINRSTKEVTPTYAGRIFYEHAKKLLALKHNTVERIRNLSGNLNGRISILASSVPAQYILPYILSCFNKNYPEILFDVKQVDSLEVSHGIASQKADIGFSGGLVCDGKCDFVEIMSERLIFIAPYNNEYLDTKEYKLEDLLYKHSFISREKGSGTRTEYEEFFIRHNIDLAKINVCASFDNTQSILNAVSSGMGISIISEFAARAAVEQKNIIHLKLTTNLPKRKFYYVLKKNISHSHLTEQFIEFLQGNRLTSS